MTQKNCFPLLIIAGLFLLCSSCSIVKHTSSSTDKDLLTAKQRKYDYFFLEAMRMKERGSFSQAFGLLQHCLDIEPDEPSALYELSNLYLQLRQQTQGEAFLQKAVERAADNYWYYQQLANLYLQQNKTQDAITLFEEMLERFPSKQEPVLSLLELYNKEGNYENVISMLNILEKQLGKNEQLSMEKFRVYLNMQNDAEAFHEIESLIEEYPSDLRYQVMLGDVYLQKDKLQEAYDIYQQVLAVEADNSMALYSMATYYHQIGQEDLSQQLLDKLLMDSKTSSTMKTNIMRLLIMDKAQQKDKDLTPIINKFEAVIELDSEDTQLLKLYTQYLLSNNMEEQSVPIMERIISLEPTNSTIRLSLLQTAVKAEDYNRIITICEPGIVATPEILEFYYFLAIAYNHAEEHDAALDICQKALLNSTKDSPKEVISDFFAIMGDIYYLKQRPTETYAAYDSALVYYALNYSALNNYAYYLSLELKDLDKAEEMSYKTVKANPENATYLDTYAWILFQKGNYAQARIYIDSAIKNGGDESDVVVEHCGDIHYMTQDEENALKYWQQALKMGSQSETLRQKIKKKKYIAP